jgi:Ni,Fe-hydrogenase III large subunit
VTEVTPAPDDLPTLLGVEEPGAPGELRLLVPLSGLSSAAGMLRDAGARFVTLLCADSPAPSLMAAFALRGDLVVLRAPIGDDKPVGYQSLGAWWPAARWAEQELVERQGIVAIGARYPRRLVAPDADELQPRVEGLDAFPIPYGPVRSGVFEAIQFQIESGGESVLRLQTRPFFKHRGMESRFVGLEPHRAAYVAERVAGIASVAYACAFAQAVERALGVSPAPVAERWRTVHAEMERVACHLDVIAKQAETAALYVGQSRFQILKEQVTRMRARLTGSRFGRGVVVPGGVCFAGRVGAGELRSFLDRLESDLRRDRRLFIGTSSMTDRLIGSGELPRDLVESYGGVGPVARGSGVSTDARHERPYGDYRRSGTVVITHRETDAMARVQVRFDELFESLRLLHQAVEQLARSDEGPLQVPLPSAAGAAFGWAEAPQGELVAWVELRSGRVHRVHFASPSLRNWALFHHAFPSDVLTDFAFIEHSFGLTPAGADR